MEGKYSSKSNGAAEFGLFTGRLDKMLHSHMKITQKRENLYSWVQK